MVRARRKARMLTLQVLYEVDSVGHEVEEAMAYLLAQSGLSGENAAFTHDLVSGVIQNKEKIDYSIQSFAPAWPIGQIPVVDRNILRLAIFEILHDNKVPVKVVINEAVELAKAFGSDNSSKFINGVLGSVSDHAVNREILQGEVENVNHL
ncbi:transcription antitermination factor NusB [Chloroflexota bacterium]